MRDTHIKWRDQEIESKSVRCLAYLTFLLALPLVLGVMLLSVPLHLILRALGRQGFLSHNESEGYTYYLTSQGFRPQA